MVYGDGARALDRVSLSVAPGCCLAILGTSGSGKTTLLRLVNRLLEPTSGSVDVRERPTREWNPIELRRSMGYVIQEAGLMPHLDVLRNVALPLRARGVPVGEREARSLSMLELVGLPPATFARRKPHQLSGGQRQRVGVARALVTSPDLMLMDEPFGALDPITRRELVLEFNALRRRLGTTVILVSHDVREAILLADQLALVHEGRLLQTGSAAELRDHPADPFVARFFEESRGVSPASEA